METKKVELKQDIVSEGEISFRIPRKLIEEFGEEARIVIRHPWVVGIPIPERFKPDMFKGIRDFDLIVTPKFKTAELIKDDPVPIREISFRIPNEIIARFKEEPRIVIRRPWVVGIPIPELLKPDILKGMKEFDVMATPRYQ